MHLQLVRGGTFLHEPNQRWLHNDGFYRDDAKLNWFARVGRAGAKFWIQQPSDVSYHVSLFQSLKTDPNVYAMHAVAADATSSSGCYAQYDPRYENAANETGGLYLSICATDWGSHLETLAENSTADLSSFELTDIPGEAIEVRVDGVPTVQGWSYNPVDNSVDFDEGYVPGGSTVDVDYTLMGDCVQ